MAMSGRSLLHGFAQSFILAALQRAAARWESGELRSLYIPTREAVTHRQ
jgi:hypothetical protein